MRFLYEVKLSTFRELMSLGRHLWQIAVRDGWLAATVACFVVGAALLAFIAALLGPFQ